MTDMAAILAREGPFIRSIAAQKQVVPDISPSDMLFDFLVKLYPGDNQKAVEGYLSGGSDCAHKFAALCAEHQTQPLNILEFASGYGRVARFAKSVLPKAEWTCCDIHQEAVEFIKDKLSLDTFISPSRPQNWTDDRRFNVVFALSFFSHMPKTTFGPWLARLFELLERDGLLIFTTHGPVSLANLQASWPEAAFDETGFYWNTSSEQLDLDAAEYGLSVVTRAYVEQQISKLPGAHLIRYELAFWWAHQDLYVVRRA